MRKWRGVRLDGPFEVGKTTKGMITYPGYEHMEWESTYGRHVPERLFVFSWSPSALHPDTEYEDGAKVTVEFRLEPIEGGTRLTITDSGLPQFPE